jgi:hypothetical protein
MFLDRGVSLLGLLAGVAQSCILGGSFWNIILSTLDQLHSSLYYQNRILFN